jgi:hypothetical protein
MKHKDELSGIPKAKRDALARRALITARWLEDRARVLMAEMKNQKIDFHDFGEDGDMTFTLAPRDARSLVHGMRDLTAEIRRFSK